MKIGTTDQTIKSVSCDLEPLKYHEDFLYK